MKKMKTKRFLSLLLALAMSFSLAVPAFAAPAANDPNDGIMPLATLYEDTNINNTTGDHITTSFTSTPGNGRYIKVWFRNYSDATATVKLFRTGSSTPVKTLVVNGHDDKPIFYIGSNTTPISYYVKITMAKGYSVNGYLAVAQKDTMN